MFMAQVTVPLDIASLPTHLSGLGRLSSVCILTPICGQITAIPKEPHYYLVDEKTISPVAETDN
jgi:hypothetical protein